MIGENKLLSVISILGTALAICMIMVIVILYVVNTASFKPEVNRGRTCYITTVMSNGKDDNRRISYSSLGLPLVKECCYPLKGAEAVTAINMDRYRPLTASSMDGLKNRTSYISYTDTAFWKIFQFDFQQGGPFSPAAFTSGIRDAVISESVALALFGTDQVVGRARIGKLPIHVPAGVTVTIKDNVVTVKGPKGELVQEVNPDINVTLEDGVIHLTRPTDDKNHRALHGLYRSLINNMVVGCSEGYKKELELVGVGYRVSNTGQLLDLSLGYTHNIYLQLPKEVKVETKSERNKNPLIILESADKQLLGQICAKIRSFRMPEPYKGKGIKFVGEEIRRKSGKSAGK